MRGAELLDWLASLSPDARDAAFEAHLGIASSRPSDVPPGEHLIGYHASGVDPILHAIASVPITREDVLVDLGAGLGKVVLLTHLVTGARSRGVEIQSALVVRARAAAARVGAEVSFVEGDARRADLDDGTVFFLYLPFTGPALKQVLDRLCAIAAHHAIVVCTLGLDLDREAPWLVRRSIDSFWLAIYDSRERGTLAAP